MTPVLLTTNEKVLVFPSNFLASHCHPVFLYFRHPNHVSFHSFSSTCIYLGYTLAVRQFFSLKRRIDIISQKPPQLLQDNVTASLPFPKSPILLPCVSINHIVLSMLDLPCSLPLSSSRVGTISYLCILSGTEKLRARMHKYESIWM